MKIKQPLTTAAGTITLVVSGLVLYGVITAEEGEALTSTGSALVTAAAGFITAIISIFRAKDPGSKEEVGI